MPVLFPFKRTLTHITAAWFSYAFCVQGVVFYNKPNIFSFSREDLKKWNISLTW